LRQTHRKYGFKLSSPSKDKSTRSQTQGRLSASKQKQKVGESAPQDAPQDLIVLLVDADPERVRVVEQGLSGFAVVRKATSLGAVSLLDQINHWQPDVIIIDCDAPDRDTIENLRTVARENPKPIVMFVEDGDGTLAREAIRAGVSAYIVDGLTEVRVRPVLEVAIERFKLVNELRQELEKSKADLAARKVIEKAKGVLMTQRGLSENDAYSAMRNMAMKQGKPLKEVAENIISVADLLRG
jgi:response regulator NasT